MFGRKKMNEQMLTDITRGIHHAVNTTGTMIAQQYIMMLQQFFDTEEDGGIAAKMVKIQVDEKHDMLVPLIAMINPQGIALEKMRFEMSIQISESEMKRATHEVDNFNAGRTSFKVLLSPKTDDSSRRHTDIVDVVMEFTRTEPPEGIARLIEHYTNMIRPFETDGSDGGEPDSDGDHTDRGPAEATLFKSTSAPARSPRKLNIVKMNTKATGDMPDPSQDKKP